MTDVVKDIGNPNRFRWNIYENKRVRDKSFYSFATKREAQNDADKFVRKLNVGLAGLEGIESPRIQDALRIVELTSQIADCYALSGVLRDISVGANRRDCSRQAPMKRPDSDVI